MAVRFARSAARHGISPERAQHVVENCLAPIYPPPDEADVRDRVVFLGPDQYGVPLEVVAFELGAGDYLVIHVMKLRRRYWRDYSQVMKWGRRT